MQNETCYNDIIVLSEEMMRSLGTITKVYHGTTSAYSKSFERGIDLNFGDAQRDFGKGFYATSQFRLARSYARNRTMWYNLRHIAGEPVEEGIVRRSYPMVVSYAVDIQALLRLTGMEFLTPDKRWSEFVLNNRLGPEHCVSGFHNFKCQWEYVYGGLADNRIIMLVQRFKLKEIGFETFHRLVRPIDKNDHNQLSFHTQSAIGCLIGREMVILK
jgi:hypothetical protein